MSLKCADLIDAGLGRPVNMPLRLTSYAAGRST